MTVRGRIYLALTFTVVAGVWYLLYWIIAELEPRYRASVEESLVDSSRILAAAAGNDVRDGKLDIGRLEQIFKDAYTREFQARIYEVPKTKVDMRVYVTDRTGKVLYDSTGRLKGRDLAAWRDVSLTLRGGYGARTTRDDPDDPGSSVLYVAAPIFSGGEIVGTLTVGEPTRGLNQFIALAKKRIYTGAIITAASILLAGLLLSLLITRPVGMMLDYLALLRNSGNVTLPRLGRSAIGIIGRTYEEMKEALEGRSYVERYVQTLTHELKGPLSAVRGAAELLHEDLPPEKKAQFLKNIQNETSRIQMIVDRLLELAALEAKRGLQDVQKIDLKELVSQTADDMTAAGQPRGIKLTAAIAEGQNVRGDPFLIRQALANLLQNAIDFSSNGSEIRVEAARKGRQYELTVTDSGCGIPEYALDKIFNRFYSLKRPVTGRKSTGLGLSFVKEIADLHRGHITLENRKEGGVRAVLSLPAVE